MDEVSIIAVDLAKRVFHVHGARADGSVAFRKKLSRAQMLAFFERQPCCVVAMEACASAHFWGREIGALGHDVRLVPPIYVKPFVKRQKNDAADAEAIAEAASRPTMRFVPVKSADSQAKAVVFRTRALLVKQRTQLVNALRGHLGEYGVVAARNACNVRALQRALDDPETVLPDVVRMLCHDYIEQIAHLSGRIDVVERTLRAQASDEASTRLRSIPGVGAVTAAAIGAFAPPLTQFRRGRDFAAWLGLVPRQHSTGGKERLGKTSKMGQRDIRRLLIIGAMAVVRVAEQGGAGSTPWLRALLARKPRMLAAVALANKMARMIWAVATSGRPYRGPAAA
jgi:transposase